MLDREIQSNLHVQLSKSERENILFFFLKKSCPHLSNISKSNPLDHFDLFVYLRTRISFSSILDQEIDFSKGKKIERRIMQIFVRTLDDRTLTLNVQSDQTINDVKEIVEQREGKFDRAFTIVHLQMERILLSFQRHSR